MNHHTSRRAVLGAGAMAALAGCLGLPGSAADTGSTAADGTGTPTAAPEGAPPTAAERLPLQHDLSKLRDSVVSGGPGKDGIPSIDSPSFVSPDGADEFLAPGDPVFGVAGENDVKAYPQAILVWHEITNDVLDGVPVTVSYCPLTGTAMGFARGETTFGVSGRLVNNNLVMYDRATDSRWPQILGTAISGEFAGRSLQEFRLVWSTWERWRAAHPETRVLSRNTGYARDYTRDPYGKYNPRRGYYAAADHTLFETLHEDDRLGGKDVVIGSRSQAGVLAFEKATLRERGVVHADHDGAAFVAVHDPALDTGYVYLNPDGASVERGDDGVGVDGEAHPPDDLPLEQVYAFDAMWFAWAGFYPGTGLYA